MQATLEQRVGAEQFDHETRRYNDTVTWLAEVLPGSMRTPFEYRYGHGELYASDGSALGAIFDKSIEEARGLPAYEQRRRRIEKQEYRDMIAMMACERPNTMIVVSDFPPELMDAYEDVGGYNVARKQTMLRVLIRNSEGRLLMFSQSLDGSNRRALETIYEYFGARPQPGELLGQRITANTDAHEQAFLVDNLTAVYDRSLQAQYGGSWYAGQLNGERTNTYDFVCQQQDLLSAYLSSTTGFTGSFKDYALAAAMRDRYIGGTPQSVRRLVPYSAEAIAFAQQEMYRAGNFAQARGETFSGCGASIPSRQNTSAESQLGEAGYGNQADKPEGSTEKLVWRKGTCRIENCPTRPGKTDVAQCSVCRGCQHWFDKGHDPAKLYKGLKRVQKESVTVQFGSRKETNIKKTSQ